MPYISANGIRLAYERVGRGERVLLIMGQAAGGNVWSMYQVPALKAAEYEVITFDNKGVPPSDVPPGGYSLADLVADTAGLIEALTAGPCRVVGTSLGAWVASALAVARPDPVTRCVLMAVRARVCSGIQLPAVYEASVAALQMFSPATLDDDAAISGWRPPAGRMSAFPMTSSALCGYAPKWPKSSRTETMSR